MFFDCASAIIPFNQRELIIGFAIEQVCLNSLAVQGSGLFVISRPDKLTSLLHQPSCFCGPSGTRNKTSDEYSNQLQTPVMHNADMLARATHAGSSNCVRKCCRLLTVYFVRLHYNQGTCC